MKQLLLFLLVSKMQSTIYHYFCCQTAARRRMASPQKAAIEIGNGCVEACDLRTLSDAEASYSRSVKEVIQPQVPLRLPCYDFAPVTALAFGRLLPCGLLHGLRALTASMA